MKIGIIGAGRVGCAFALALANRGIEVSGVCNRTIGAVAFHWGDLRTNNLDD